MALKRCRKVPKKRSIDKIEEKNEINELLENAMEVEQNPPDYINDTEDDISEVSDGNIAVDADEDVVSHNKSGVLYFSSIPPRFTPQRLQVYFEKYAPGLVGRVFLEKNKRTKSRENRFTEGWLEIKRKKLAKRIAKEIDNTPVGGKKRDPASSSLWNIKYLSGFKWVHLVEQLEYEKSSHTRRMTTEINQARRIAAHFEEQVEKGENLRKLEKKVLQHGGSWEKTHERQISQKQALKRKEGKKKTGSDLMTMIFTS